MQERERILELVKKGILSTEEALVLLESMAQVKDEAQIQKEAEKVTTEKDRSSVEVNHEDLPEDLKEALKTAESSQADKLSEKAAEKAELEESYAKLAEEANQTSAELDEIQAEISGLVAEIKEKKEEKQVYDTMEDLGTLTESKEDEREDLVDEIKDLEDELADLKEEEKDLLDTLKDLNKERFQTKKEKMAQKFEIPEDWKDQAQDTMSQVGDKVYEAGNQLGSFLKKTFSGIADAVNENVDWKEVNFRVPGVATTKFQHVFNYPEVQASLIDVKLANGSITFKNHDSQDVKVEADIKLYGKLEGKTPLEVFLEKSQIDVDDEVISFQIPNKRTRADLVFYLPEKVYDHVSLKLLNGDVKISDLEAKDIYTKATNGELSFTNVEASMLEVHGVNGDTDVTGGTLRDLSIDSVNGDITLKAVGAKSIQTSLVDGDVRMTLVGSDLSTLAASSVNGDVKIALPKDLSVTGTLKTSFGGIEQRLTDLEVLQEKNNTPHSDKRRYLEFERLTDGENVATISATTTTGKIYLKDTDEK